MAAPLIMIAVDDKLLFTLNRGQSEMKVYTIGYGGRKPHEFLDLLKPNSIKALLMSGYRRAQPKQKSFGRSWRYVSESTSQRNSASRI
jgi:hypothetical protein